MTVRFTGRHDGLLFAGLALAVLTAFDQTVGRVLELLYSVDAAYHLRLVPALLVLVGVYVAHLVMRRQEMKALASTAAAEARVARERARDLEQISVLGRSLASSLTLDVLRAALWRHLPALAEHRHLWVALGEPSSLTLEVETTGNAEVATVAEEAARRVLQSHGPAGGADDSGIREGRYRCFIIYAGERPLGVVGVSEEDSPMSERVQRLLSAVAAQLGIAVKNVQLFSEIQENALTDSLTMCFNRGHVFHVVDAELRRARRSGSILSVVMFDVDQFKAINDRNGHLAGDRVLAAIGESLLDILRASDVRGRFGGDEFLLVLPDTPSAGAAHVAESIRREIESLRWAGDGPTDVVTASFGVASSVPGEVAVDTLVARADRALYEAKRAGRNMVQVADAPALPEYPSAVRRLG